MVNLKKSRSVTINGTPFQYRDCRILYIDIPARTSRLQPGAHRRPEQRRRHVTADFADEVSILVLTLTNGKYLYVTTDWAIFLLDKAMAHGEAYRNRLESKIFTHDKRCVEFYRTCKSAYLYGAGHVNDGDMRLGARTRHFRMPYLRFKGERAADVEGIEVVSEYAELLAIEQECHARDLFDLADDTGGSYHFKFGDVLGIPRKGYHHYGIYEGDDQVVHFSGQDGDFSSENTIHEAPLSKFADDIKAIETTEFPHEPGMPAVHTAYGPGGNSDALEQLIPEFMDALIANKQRRSTHAGTSGVSSRFPSGLGEAAASSLFGLNRALGYHRYNPGQTVARAKSRLTARGYALPFNNCEHLAVWSETGMHESYQVNNYLGKVAEAALPALGSVLSKLISKG